MTEPRSDDAIRADLATIAGREWLSKYDDEMIHRLAADVAPLLARAAAADDRAEKAEAETRAVLLGLAEMIDNGAFASGRHTIDDIHAYLIAVAHTYARETDSKE